MVHIENCLIKIDFAQIENTGSNSLETVATMFL